MYSTHVVRLIFMFVCAVFFVHAHCSSQVVVIACFNRIAPSAHYPPAQQKCCQQKGAHFHIVKTLSLQLGMSILLIWLTFVNNLCKLCFNVATCSVKHQSTIANHWGKHSPGCSKSLGQLSLTPPHQWQPLGTCCKQYHHATSGWYSVSSVFPSTTYDHKTTR